MEFTYVIKQIVNHLTDQTLQEGAGKNTRKSLIRKSPSRAYSSIHEEYASSLKHKIEKAKALERKRGEKVYYERERFIEKPQHFYKREKIKPYPEFSKELIPFKKQFKPFVVQKTVPLEKGERKKEPFKFYVSKEKRITYLDSKDILDSRDIPFPNPLKIGLDENKNMLNRKFMKQLFSYAMIMCHKTLAPNDTFYLSIEIFNAFMCNTTIVYRSDQMQLILTVCVFIANKYVDDMRNVHLFDVKLFSFVRDIDIILETEDKILHTIDYKIMTPMYEVYIGKIIGWKILNPIEMGLTRFFLDIASIYNVIHCHFNPSLVVVICVILSLQYNVSSLNLMKSVIYNSGYSVKFIKRSIQYFNSLTMRSLNTPQLNNDLQMKYTSFIVDEIGTTVPIYSLVHKRLKPQHT